MISLKGARMSVLAYCTSVTASCGPGSKRVGSWHVYGSFCKKGQDLADQIQGVLKYNILSCMAGRRRQELEAIHSPSVPQSPRRDSGGAHRDVLGVAALRAVGLARGGKPAYQHLNAW